MSFYGFIKFFCALFLRLFFKVKVVGKSNINCKLGSLILVSNHKSNLDPVLLGLYSKRRLYFMAKEELFVNPIFGYIIKKLGAFPVKRNSRDAGAVSCAKSIIDSGKILALFPEGTRSKTDEILKFKLGAVRLAVASGCEILPCSIFYAKGGFRRRVFLEYGKALTWQQLANNNILNSSNLSHGVLAEISSNLRNIIVKMNKSQKDLY